jgi:hypothetical protein
METTSRKSIVGRLVRFGLVGLAASAIGLTALFSSSAPSASASTGWVAGTFTTCDSHCSATVRTFGKTITVSPSASSIGGYQTTGQTVWYFVYFRDVTTNSGWSYFTAPNGPYFIPAQNCSGTCPIGEVVSNAGPTVLPSFSFTNNAGHRYEIRVLVAFALRTGGYIYGYNNFTSYIQQSPQTGLAIGYPQYAGY